MTFLFLKPVLIINRIAPSRPLETSNRAVVLCYKERRGKIKCLKLLTIPQVTFSFTCSFLTIIIRGKIMICLSVLFSVALGQTAPEITADGGALTLTGETITFSDGASSTTVTELKGLSYDKSTIDEMFQELRQDVQATQDVAAAKITSLESLLATANAELLTAEQVRCIGMGGMERGGRCRGTFGDISNLENAHNYCSHTAMPASTRTPTRTTSSTRTFKNFTTSRSHHRHSHCYNECT